MHMQSLILILDHILPFWHTTIEDFNQLQYSYLESQTTKLIHQLYSYRLLIYSIV